MQNLKTYISEKSCCASARISLEYPSFVYVSKSQAVRLVMRDAVSSPRISEIQVWKLFTRWPQ